MDETTITTETTTTNGQAEGFAAAAVASAQAELERKQAAKPPRIKHENLPVKLTKEELNDVGDRVAALDEERKQLEDAKKNAAADYKAKIAHVEQQVRQALVTIRTKHEIREVEVVEEFVFATNTVRTYRADDPDKRTLSSRAMTRAERQAELPGVDRNASTLPPGDGTDIDDPQGVLGGEDDGGEKPRRKRGKKSSS